MKQRAAAEAATAKLVVTAADAAEEPVSDVDAGSAPASAAASRAPLATAAAKKDLHVKETKETRLVTLSVFEDNRTETTKSKQKDQIDTTKDKQQNERRLLFVETIEWPLVVQAGARWLDINTFNAYFGFTNVTEIYYCIINDTKPEQHHKDPKAWQLAHENKVPLAVNDSVLLQVYVRDRSKITIGQNATVASGVKRKSTCATESQSEIQQKQDKLQQEESKQNTRLVSYVVFNRDNQEVFRNERYWKLLTVDSRLALDITSLSVLFGVDNIVRLDYRILSQNQQGLSQHAKGMREYKSGDVIYTASGGQFGALLHVTIRNMEVWQQVSIQHTPLKTKRDRSKGVWFVRPLTVPEQIAAAASLLKEEKDAQEQKNPRVKPSEPAALSDHVGVIISTTEPLRKTQPMIQLQDENLQQFKTSEQGKEEEEPKAKRFKPAPHQSQQQAPSQTPEPDFTTLKDEFMKNQHEKSRIQVELAEAKKDADEVEKQLKIALETNLALHKTETQKLQQALNQQKERKKTMESLLASIIKPSSSSSA